MPSPKYFIDSLKLVPKSAHNTTTASASQALLNSQYQLSVHQPNLHVFEKILLQCAVLLLVILKCVVVSTLSHSCRVGLSGNGILRLPALRCYAKGTMLIVVLGVFVEPPSFIRAAQPTEGLKGKDVSLYCEMSGTAPFQITWFKDKKPLMESRKYKILSEASSATLHIMSIEASDVGQYECKVSNSVGSDNCQTSVKLRGQ